MIYITYGLYIYAIFIIYYCIINIMYQWRKNSSILKLYFRVANKLIMLYTINVNILFIIIAYYALCNMLCDV